MFRHRLEPKQPHDTRSGVVWTVESHRTNPHPSEHLVFPGGVPGAGALALDLMEPFRPLVADSAVVSAINTRMLMPKDFAGAGRAVALTAQGRKAFFRAYELRMDTLVTHPLFDYRVGYRRLLEIQARLLARYIEGEIEDYPVFVTR